MPWRRNKFRSSDVQAAKFLDLRSVPVFRLLSRFNPEFTIEHNAESARSEHRVDLCANEFINLHVLKENRTENLDKPQNAILLNWLLEMCQRIRIIAVFSNYSRGANGDTYSDFVPAIIKFHPRLLD